MCTLNVRTIRPYYHLMILLLMKIIIIFNIYFPNVIICIGQIMSISKINITNNINNYH